MVPNSSEPSCVPDRAQTRTRRSVLALAATGASALAGCLGGTSNTTETPEVGKDDDDGGESTDSPTPRPSLPSFTNWAYPRGYDGAVGPYGLRFYDLETILANRDQLPEGFPEFAERQTEGLALLDGTASKDEVTTLVSVDGSLVYNGPWAKAEMEDAIEAFMDINAAGSQSGYSLYTHAELEEGYAIGDGQFIVGTLSGDGNEEVQTPLDTTKALIAVQEGTIDRYADVSSDFRTIMAGDRTGYYTQAEFYSPDGRTNYSTQQIKGKKMERLIHRLEDGVVRAELWFLFDAEENTSTDKATRYAEKSLTAWKNTEVTQEGPRLVKLEGAVTN